MQRRMNEGRRRTGCWTCKCKLLSPDSPLSFPSVRSSTPGAKIDHDSAKHVQCTEERPSCSRCLRLHLDCQYGLRLLWKEDALQRNISLGREGKWSKTHKKCQNVRSDPGKLFKPINLSAYTGEWIFLNATKNDFTICSIMNYDPSDYPSNDLEPELETETLDLIPPELDQVEADPGQEMAIYQPGGSLCMWSYSTVEGNLFNYFIVSICPSCSLSESDNPYLTYLVPMSFNFPTLQNALLAVSANQLRLLNDKRFEMEAWYHKSKAIQGVQRAIDAGRVDVGIVATVLMLCFYDISDGCNRAWVTHLRGGLTLLDQLSQSAGPREDSNLHAFLRMYFVAHDIMSRTACDEIDVDHSREWVEDETIDEIDVLMGCSRSLMNLVRRISTLASHAKMASIPRQINLELTNLQSKISQRIGGQTSEIEALIVSRDLIERSIQSLKQILPSGVRESSTLPRIAEIKRLTALLYLHERLIMLPSSHTQGNSPTVCRFQLIATIISLISTLPDSPTLLWPLFILGNTALGLDEEQRRFVHQRLTTLRKVRNLGSVRRARLVVEDTWKKIDLEVKEPTHGAWLTRRTRNIISLA
ncbi:uncharacterized protein BP5553_08486 [Venustampulla echinocandica]|uniref:Zn(2)-C6 fungal-type domain-containing protein n=1 Tax=Venustampulla echinocandica TaxID=2656787 RepID=A0A370TEC2_9HELO|nr:uncharacterized protein BP5553_08486 [Venustampulla echinocandica]RDL33047.1 hypothetical protein BP5553_08486 [Venustampulla echinocandica]